jgi:hypothetical protein
MHSSGRSQILSLCRMLIGEISRFPKLGQAFYDYGPKQEIADIERVLSGVMPPREARARAEAFFYLIMGHACHQVLLGRLPEKTGAATFESQIRTAIRLVLPESTKRQSSTAASKLLMNEGGKRI